MQPGGGNASNEPREPQPSQPQLQYSMAICTVKELLDRPLSASPALLRVTLALMAAKPISCKYLAQRR
jgi:hypothetical protein